MPSGFGLDGCRAGWVLAIFTGGIIQFHVLKKIDELVKFQLPPHILIDMPIGLPSGESSSRELDRLLKRHFGRFHAKVFLVPNRKIVSQSDYSQANQLSKDLYGKGLSKQSWYIFPKILELDCFFKQSPHIAATCHESHPELCFAQHNDGKILHDSKKTPQGLDQRKQMIIKHVPQFEREYSKFLSRYPRSQIMPDDLLDAAILALHAHQPKSYLTTSESDPILKKPIELWL